jgi:hypothetical protein
MANLEYGNDAAFAASGIVTVRLYWLMWIITKKKNSLNLGAGA